MPELPEVEHSEASSPTTAEGSESFHVDVLNAPYCVTSARQRLRRALEGRRFLSPRRHGKWLVARTDGPTLLVHFGMTSARLEDQTR